MRGLIILALICWACGKPGGSEHPNSAKFQQYYNQGEQLYSQHCSNCHQKTGTGLGLVYPPLNKSDFVDQHFEEVICLMRNGRKGELIVNGKMYNQAMPATTLSDLEIAEIATYIYNTWGRDRGLLEVNQIATQLQQCDSVPSVR
ncbi:cytochrome c [Chryseolinea sp. T2]|uniref:c-type cytochrome n=1 Tax=Chryseolinea sp. T2 TaxID=3129255 RepID=UPI00307763CA